MSANRPPRLYKYQAVTVQTLTNLRDGIIWFSGPRDFNDPFDCNAAIPSRRSLSEYREHLKRTNSDSYYLLEKILADGKADAAELEQGLYDTLLAAMKPAHEQFVFPRGVACFSAVSDHILMWAHYAQGHRGMCLEFDSSEPPFSSVEQVLYQEDAPQIDPIALREHTLPPREMVRQMMLVKYSCWEYEEEWRVLGERARSPAKYRPQALTGIYFGAEMLPEHRRLVAQAVAGHDVRLYQMSRAVTGFALTSAPVEDSAGAAS